MKGKDPEILSENDRLTRCKKNPGHIEFIPVSNFVINHLPTPYRNVEVFENIRTLAALTVRIVVKGKVGTHYGTGKIWQVENHALNNKCPCLYCQSSDQCFKRVWFIYVTTAAHLIGDDKEPSTIRADVSYDNQFEKEKIRVLYGHKIVEKCDKSDTCKIIFITHDDDLADELTQHVQNFRNYISGHQYHTNSEHYAVIVSHPHGSSKKISIGSLSRSGSRNKKTRVLESQLVNVEVEVHFPDGECSKRMIWMLDRKLKDTKEFLLQEAGINDDPKQWNLVMHYSHDRKVIMDDNMITRDYINDLTVV
ncbi:unnamed protein product [Lymnaea stagnalis]|uniref:Ubiquitin-like domain-containing protein n=1 Tax=Lymnaea stagnalis TaxID=6523 RepID=A0AAV2I854_LYMST